jgi:hypothetical protein
VDIKKRVAAFLDREGIKGCQRSRMMACISIMESTNQPAPEFESSVPAVAVGVLRA